MKFKLSTGEDAEIGFHHHTECMDDRRYTTAGVAIGARHWAAVAHVHPKDTYSKVKGRKIALRRALENTPREIRKEIWRALLESGMRVT